jgi:hypothetical protein
MGIPPAALGSGFGKSSSTQSEAASETLRMTTQSWAQILSEVLLDIYRLLHDGESDKIIVVFPSIQSHKEMKSLFDGGILTFDAYKAWISNASAIPSAHMERNDPRIVQESPQGS